MEKVQKDIIKRENIIEDMIKYENEYRSIYWEWRLAYIIPYLTFAIALISLGIYLEKGTLFFIAAGVCVLVAAFHIFQLVTKLLYSNKIIKAIKNCEFTVMIEKLSNISKETLYEPHYGRVAGNSRVRTTSEATFLWFGPLKWRIFGSINHYAWSKEFYLSGEGVFNTSVEGNEFFVVTNNFNNQIGVVYNTKFFDWKG